ncbi:Glycerate kinase [Caligus rogercresseyi]|uniref:Glycerate kinase n=1 Tax=Caligus rogercresseyi TaxID=217165 RepID=A0A7T8HFP9_CALRO|nr:Glycerate kinase [Caligus rogercresseyi]
MSDLKEVVTQVISGLDPTPRIHEHLSKHKHDRPLTVVGFGKAVYRMAVGMDIISIPHEQKEIPCLSTIRVRKGARRNLPDEDSHIATKEILTCLSGMKEDSHCVILISGGGSACLCAPKRDIIHLLSIYGASIYEINTVRKRLSAIKGIHISLIMKSFNIRIT